MLEQLTATNFVLSLRNEIGFKGGMTAITGETGAGKSLSVDAISAVTGARAEAGWVRKGAERAEVEALFGTKGQDALRKYLKERDLEDEEGDLALRRIIGADGKSRAYVNGHSVTLATLREIGQFLIAVHGQHASVKLMDQDRQLELLDAFGALDPQLAAVKAAFEAYNRKRQELQKLSDEQKDGAAAFREERRDLEEMRKLDLGEGDYEALSERYDALAHAQENSEAIALAQAALGNDGGNVLDVLSSRISDLEDAAQYDHERLDPVVDLMTNACKLLDEARESLSGIEEDSDPAEANEVGQKLSMCHELARRFHTDPAQLYLKRQELEDRLAHFLSLKDSITALASEVKELRAAYEEKARVLSEARAKAADDMSAKVTAMVRDLAMPDGVFRISLKYDSERRPRPEGRDEALFMFSANRGQDPGPLGSVASGGELSRLALAIEVLTAGRNSTPTLIFDEVDTGISGRTASAVGSLLSRLGRTVQVLAVTHLPQVAAAASNQLLVSKEDTEDGGTLSRVSELDSEGRVREIARMMGGSVVTDATLEGARALLSHAG
ncbi:MAG: DNA repair protein RecN [Aeromonadales bacterium]|nr:DNA repair protein RecN [Aeromonadales bacterium]MDY2889919.1 DNA repair protein RecN [Succinivibrio sp.]